MSDNICLVNEKVLRAAANFAMTNQKKTLAPIFIIVPDRFTLQAEKILTAVAPCLLGVRVVTFSMLFNILQGFKRPSVIDKTTAVLFTWRAIQDVKTDLQYFNNSADQYAFGEKMFNTVNQLTSCNADFATLESNAKTQTARRKMHDIAIIQKRYKELLGEQVDGSGILAWLIENIATAQAIKDAHVYITGFEYLSVQREEVIRRIMRTARSFTAGCREGSELQRRLNEIRFAM
jgi:ATP-dependent helicase/nuclease subunit B